MPEVKVRDGEQVEDAIRRFKRECERDGVLQEIRRREYYMSPAVKRKRKLAEARRRQRRKRF